MIAKVFDLFFGCSHDRYSFPMSSKAGQRRSDAASLTGTYVVCLNCGREFPYDWQEMKIVSAPQDGGGRVAAAAQSYAEK